MKFTVGFLMAALPLLTAAADFEIVKWTCSEPMSGDSWVDYSVREGGQSGCDGCQLVQDEDDNWYVSTTGHGCDRGFTAPEDKSSFETGGGSGGKCVTYKDPDACQLATAACALLVTHRCDYDD